MNILEKVAYQNATKMAMQIDLAAIQVLNPPKWICEVKEDSIVLMREWIYKVYCRMRKFEVKVEHDNDGGLTYYFFIKGKIRKILKIN